MWAYHGLPCAHGLFIVATLAQEEEDDSQDGQRQRGKTGWAFQKTKLESLLSTSARAPPPFRERTNCDEVRKSRARHGRTQTQTETLAIVKQKERTKN